jgi:hypothetical protein
MVLEELCILTDDNVGGSVRSSDGRRIGQALFVVVGVLEDLSPTCGRSAEPAYHGSRGALLEIEPSPTIQEEC